MLQVFKTTGRMPEQLKAPCEMPDGMEYFFKWRAELFDGEPLTYQKLYYWSETTKSAIQPWEVSVMIALDNICWNNQ